MQACSDAKKSASRTKIEPVLSPIFANPPFAAERFAGALLSNIGHLFSDPHNKYVSKRLSP
jgi:hypothetical protein